MGDSNAKAALEFVADLEAQLAEARGELDQLADENVRLATCEEHIQIEEAYQAKVEDLEAQLAEARDLRIADEEAHNADIAARRDAEAKVEDLEAERDGERRAREHVESRCVELMRERDRLTERVRVADAALDKLRVWLQSTEPKTGQTVGPMFPALHPAGAKFLREVLPPKEGGEDE